jgi:serine/threonine protein kinase
MEYVQSDDVRRMTKKAKEAGLAIPLGIIIRIIADAAAGLDHAHKARDAKGNLLNLVHRDVSPQNILVGFDGGIKLIDFGVAKAAGRAQHTGTGILKGKFPYMSPEQAEGEDIDARSDVFALGIVLWELLTDRRLFKGENDIVTQKLVKACKVPAPSAIKAEVPKELDAIVLKALAKNRDDRFPDALSMRMALEEFALAKKIPSSSAHVAAFMQPLYGERIASEADPDALDELSSESQIDPLGSSSRRASTPLTSPPGAELPSGPASRRSVMSRLGQQPNAAPRSGTQAVTSPSARKRNRRGSLIAIGATVGILLLGVVAVMLKPAQTTTTVTPVTPVDPVAKPNPPPKPVDPPPTTDPTPPPPDPVEQQRFALESVPSGADVEMEGRKVGITPFNVTLASSQLPASVKLYRDGYETGQTTLQPGGPFSVSVPLTKKRPKTGPRPPPVTGIKTGR